MSEGLPKDRIYPFFHIKGVFKNIASAEDCAKAFIGPDLKRHEITVYGKKCKEGRCTQFTQYEDANLQGYMSYSRNSKTVEIKDSKAKKILRNIRKGMDALWNHEDDILDIKDIKIRSNSIFINHYRNREQFFEQEPEGTKYKQDSLGSHSDKGKDDSPVFSITLCEKDGNRPFVMTRKSDNFQMVFNLEHGDLFIMYPGCQKLWKHGVPSNAKYPGQRWNFTVRKVE